MSSLCLNSNNSSLSKDDLNKTANGSVQINTTDNTIATNGSEQSQYIVIKSRGANSDACGDTSIKHNNQLYMLLQHATGCAEPNCGRDNCSTLKQFILHHNSCITNSSGGCMICFAFDAMVCQVRLFFGEICWGKAMVAYKRPQKWKKEESERLRGERDQIKFIDIGFERWQVVRFWKARGRQDVP